MGVGQGKGLFGLSSPPALSSVNSKRGEEGGMGDWTGGDQGGICRGEKGES